MLPDTLGQPRTDQTQGWWWAASGDYTPLHHKIRVDKIHNCDCDTHLCSTPLAPSSSSRPPDTVSRPHQPHQ